MPAQARFRHGALLLAVALATACGSTVQGSSRVTAGNGVGNPQGIDDGLGGTTGLSAPQAPGGAGVTPTASQSSTGSSGGSTAGPLSSTTGRGAPGGVTPATSGPGVTDKVVYVGVVHDANADGVNSAAGVGAVTHGDSLANTRAIVDDINRHGGVAGRRVELVTADFDSTSTQTLDQQWAAVCQTFTRDSPRVFAVIEVTNESYRDCLSRAGVLMLSDNLPTIGEESFRRHPGMFELGFPNVDRLARYQVTSLVEQHYFTPWNIFTGQASATGAVKVGVLTYNDRVFSSAVDRYLVPALRRLGYDPMVERVAPLGGASDVGASAAAVKSAQLAFAANGVTHIIPFESNGGLSTFFLPTARTQAYYPRYGISTASGFEALREAGVADNRQFNGAVGFGWMPSVDLQANDNPEKGRYSNAARRHCRQVLRDHGITPDSGNAEAIALSACASLYLLQGAAARTPGHLTVGTLASAIESLGATYQGAGSLGMTFGPGRHDAADKVYHWRYTEACTCFRYDGTLRTLP
ncbi:MAG: ABC transporter substrate-binding protein [Actinomycetota bacterium]|nr:ABC transporter substrate-binding protein [Actinomycetota bacterium]